MEDGTPNWDRAFWLHQIRECLLHPTEEHSHYGVVELYRHSADGVEPITGIGAHPTTAHPNPHMLMSTAEAKEMAEFALRRAEHLLMAAVQLRVIVETGHWPVGHCLQGIASGLVRCLREEIEKPANLADMQPRSKS